MLKNLRCYKTFQILKKKEFWMLMEYLNISKKIFEINIQNIGISYKISEMLKTSRMKIR